MLLESANFDLSKDSALSTIGLSLQGGSGSKYSFGASHAGQGGVGQKDNVEATYGHFSQEPDNSYLHKSQMGSGGRSTDKRGGGVIIIRANSGIISGRILSDGSPTSPLDGPKNYEAGSGGYVYIGCKTSCRFVTDNLSETQAIISARGGFGNEAVEGLSGGGGRIVLNNVNTDNFERVKVSGG